MNLFCHFQVASTVHLHNWSFYFCRFLAWTSCLRHLTIYFLYHCHLQTKLEKHDRGGMLCWAFAHCIQSVIETNCAF